METLLSAKLSHFDEKEQRFQTELAEQETREFIDSSRVCQDVD